MIRVKLAGPHVPTWWPEFDAHAVPRVGDGVVAERAPDPQSGPVTVAGVVDRVVWIFSWSAYPITALIELRPE